MSSTNTTGEIDRGHGPRADLRLDMTSLGGDDVTMTSPRNGDMTIMSPGGSVETASDSLPMSPGSDAGRNLAVDYMKSRYEKDSPKKDPIIVPKVIREPRKLDFQWDKVVDEKLKRSDPTVPVIKEQDLVALMLTCAGLDSGKSQYLSIVENSGRDMTPVNREPVEKVAPPEITKKVRNMFETGTITDIHDSKTRNETYEVLPGSGVFENEPVRIEGVTRESDFNEEGQGVQRGLTKNLLDHWKTKMTEENSKPTPNRRIVLAEDEGGVVENAPLRRDDVVREEDLDWEKSHIEKGLTKSLMNQWSTMGSKEFKAERKRINVADAEGKVLENQPIRRNDVIRGDDVISEGESVQKGLTRNLLSQWSVKGTEETPIQRRSINVACAEGRVAENEPIRRSDVVREEDANFAGEQVEKGMTKSLLHQWSNKNKETFRLERRAINLAEDEGTVAENEPIKRSDVANAYEVDDGDVVQKGTTKSLLEQWKTKGSEEYRPSEARGYINLAEAECKVLENEPIVRTDVVRESDVVVEGEQVQKGTTRSLLNQWQNKRDEFKKDRTPINIAEAEGVVSENQPTQRNDVVRENDLDSEADRIQRGTTRTLLDQWQNKRTEFTKDKTPIVIDEAQGTVAENDPVVRTDVVREEDVVAEGDVLPRGLTQSLLGQWKTKSTQQFSIDRKPIAIAEDEGTVAENEPERRDDLIREYEQGSEVEVQKGFTRNLLSQWKNKGSEEFKAPKRQIIIAEDDGKVVENDPSPRHDVVREFDNNEDNEQIQRGFTKKLLGEWRNKGNEEFRSSRKEIVLAEDEGVVAENNPTQRSDIVKEVDFYDDAKQIQKGQTSYLLGQWKNKGNEQFEAPKRQINLAEDEGKIVENSPIQRNDVIREYDQSVDEDKIQKGFTKSLLGQWKNKGNEQYQAPKREIILAEDEGKIAENQPMERCDISSEYNQNSEGEKIQKGYTRNLLGQWKNKGNEQFQAPKREIILAEDEGKVAENQPVQRTDVIREYDANMEGETITKGSTKGLLGQWKNKANEQFVAPKREIVLAEDEGKIAENQPVERHDVSKEYNQNLEEESIQKGYTKNLLGQWKAKGNEEFKAIKREIVLAEDEGKVAENQPVQRNDVVREYDLNQEGDTIQRGYTKNLLGQWKNKGNEEYKAPKREIILAEDEGKVAENQPMQRSDVIREYDANGEGEKIQKGYTKNLLGQWKNKGNEEFRAPKREIVLAEDEGRIAENQPTERSDVFKEYDQNLEGEIIQRGYTKNLLGQWKNKGNEEYRGPKREIVLAEDEGKIVENQPVQRSDVFREYDTNLEEDKIQKGYTKNLLGHWKNKGNEEFRAPKREIVLAEDEGKVAENVPEQRSDVVREYDLNQEGEKIQKGYTRNLLGQWKNKGSEQFQAPKREIILAEDEGKVAENQPVQRTDVIREYDANMEGEKITKGSTKGLLGQWKNKANEQFVAPRREIVLAEDEGKIAENQPVERHDVSKEYNQNLEGESIQRGYTKNLLGQWKAKGNEEFKAIKKEIVLAEDEGKVAENQPVQRNDVVREYDLNQEGDKIQRGYTKNLLGQWKNKGNEEYRAPKREIILAEDEGKVAENQPMQRSDVIREYDANGEGEKIQKGYTKNLLGQWKNKGNEEFRAPKREIVLAEDEGKIVESQPVYRSDVVREYDDNLEGEKIQRGYTKNLLGQWKNKGNEEYQAVRREIVLAEDEGKIVESVPTQRNDVVREYDQNFEGDKIQSGITKNLLGQWKNKDKETFQAAKREIILAEDEGKIAENEPVRRSDVVREYDFQEEGERIQRGTTKNLLSQWKTKGTEEFQSTRPSIVLAEDAGKVCENEPIQRTDVIRENDNDLGKDLPRRGQAKDLKVQWMSSREETPKDRKPIDMIENHNEPSVVENDPVIRSDVVREGDNFEEVFLQRGFARDLAGYWQYRQEDEQPKEPFRLEMDMSRDEKSVHENEPVELQGVTRCDDPQDEVMGKRGHIQMVARQYLESNDRASPRKPQQLVDMDLADGPAVLENDPVVLGPEVVRSDYSQIDDTSVTAGLAKNMLERWKNQDLENSSPRSPSCTVDGRSVYILEMDEAQGSGVFENQPVVRTDVTREVDYEPEMIPIKQTRNTRRLWSRMEQQEGETADQPEALPELVRFTPPRELTPPPVHQEDFKSYQSITLSSGPSTPGPMSPPSQPGWSAQSRGPRPQQNHSNFNRPASASNQKSSLSGVQMREQTSNNTRPTAMQRIQPQTTASHAASHNSPQSETMKSSAVLILRPS